MSRLFSTSPSSPVSLMGYYQYPALFQETVLFVSEGELWSVPAQGGRAERRTGGLGVLYDPAFSPDGEWIAFTGTHEGHRELYVMPASGGPATRLTFFDHRVSVIGWLSPQEILFKSNHEGPFSHVFHVYSLSLVSGTPQRLNVGSAHFMTTNAQGRRVIQRHGYGYVNWKRYRGGTAGELWIEAHGGQGDFQKLLHLSSNNLTPLWVGERIYFLSDHEGHGDIYSCQATGDEIRRHTKTNTFYVRHLSRGASPEDTRLIYKQGADLFILQTTTGDLQHVPIHYPSARSEKARTFVSPLKNLTAYAPSPDGSDVLLTTRGRLFKLPPFRGPVQQLGEKEGVRYRLGQWLSKSQALAVKDKGLEEILEIFEGDPLKNSQTIHHDKWGRILDLSPSPQENAVLLTNHRHELWSVDLKTKKAQMLDKSAFGPFRGMDWSPDGAWVVYSIQISHACSILRLCHIKTHKTTDITMPLAQDFCPRFDVQGRFLYFLSFRTFHPQKDALRFDWSFQEGVKPYLITLQKEKTSPFILPSESADEPKEKEDEEAKSSSKKKPRPVLIDLENMCDRLLPFPVQAGAYGNLVAGDDKIYWLLETPLSLHEHESHKEDEQSLHSIQMYDLNTLKCETLVTDAHTMTLSRDGQWLMYTTLEKKMRLIKAGEKPEEHDTSYKAGGWIDDERVRLETYPACEWQFMFEEAWRLQKDLFWREDMGHVDWEAIRKRYLPLVERVNTQAELMDVIYEMQGELGSSHAYTWGYDEGAGVPYTLGQLGASFDICAKSQSWIVTSLDRGDIGHPEEVGPLCAPGLNIRPGTHLWAIDGIFLSAEITPEKALVHKAGTYVSLLISDSPTKKKRTVWVKPLAHIRSVRYHDWVEKKRTYVTQKTQGRVGYIHIPDMVETGFAAFFRAYLLEFDKEGLILDVRFNNGGNVSTLLLSTLGRKRLGFDQSRWEGQIPYLTESPRGPMVALCNELTASDGDMFAYSFKKMGLGPLIGKRTWGGVIGMFARHPLLDGSWTSQPEYAIWFHDIGWSLENHGAEPDIEVESTPQEEHKGVDAQLDRAITEVLQKLPDFPKK